MHELFASHDAARKHYFLNFEIFQNLNCVFLHFLANALNTNANIEAFIQKKHKSIFLGLLKNPRWFGDTPWPLLNLIWLANGNYPGWRTCIDYRL